MVGAVEVSYLALSAILLLKGCLLVWKYWKYPRIEKGVGMAHKFDGDDRAGLMVTVPSQSRVCR